jgi:hypothetical protein
MLGSVFVVSQGATIRLLSSAKLLLGGNVDITLDHSKVDSYAMLPLLPASPQRVRVSLRATCFHDFPVSSQRCRSVCVLRERS